MSASLRDGCYLCQSKRVFGTNVVSQYTSVKGCKSDGYVCILV